ncbi:MAG: hypothetical protein KAW56_03390 [Candidatus Marinimicrobia bacterium]|nr:hypothetical protein [Candidatus Neomarinimicrobiota bacterium]MCK4446105.1 hypothetical protein [Candidatus Neomarinimicrobiota bacterium]
MKNLVIIAIVVAAVALILGIITQLVGHSILISANAWNNFSQTILLFGICFGIWEYLKCKE